MRPHESCMNSEVSSDQQENLTREDQKGILIIGGIEIFLPLSPIEARECVAEGATTEGQSYMNVRELETTLMFSQAKAEE
jgi:hypothetical protein